MNRTAKDVLDVDGFDLARSVIEPAALAEFAAEIGPPNCAGRRGLLKLPCVANLARSEALIGLVRPHVGGEPFPVRSIYFNKSPQSNWLVAWHEDLTIAVRERADVAGFGPWTVKEGIPHVQPPVSILEQMLTVRVHIDDTDETNGALRVLPWTHQLGRLSPEQIAALRKKIAEKVCRMTAGDVMLMRPLILHASGRSTSDRERRVLHIEYAALKLPQGLEWHEAA